MARTVDYEIIWKVRRLFRALAAEADGLLEPAGIRASERAVLEFLYPDQAMTVPQIARRFQVSRQHIQVTVNDLLDRGLLYRKENPDHVRSPLISLTEVGRTKFTAVRDFEQNRIDDLFSGIPSGEKVLTDRVLGVLLRRLNDDS